MAESKDTGTDSKFTYKSFLNSSDTKELKDFLEKRLVDCGWRKDIEEMIRKKLEENDSANVSRDELAKSIIPDVSFDHVKFILTYVSYYFNLTRLALWCQMRCAKK